MFCPECGDEFREGFDRCPDCHVALVGSRPSTPRRSATEDERAGDGDAAEAAPASGEPELPRTDVPKDDALVTIGRYFSPFEAETNRMALEQAGLRGWVFDALTGTTYVIGVGTRLAVAAEDEAAARAVLAAQPPAVMEDPPELDRQDDEVPAPSRPDDEARPRSTARLELFAVLLFTSLYTILWDLLDKRGPDSPQPIPLGGLVARSLWYVGLSFVIWRLLQKERGPLSPLSLPESAVAWGGEILLALPLFFVVWVLDARLNHWLRALGIPDAPSLWAPTLRQPGIALVYPLSSLFAAAYGEVVFRAYYISRLPLVLGERRVLSMLVAAALFALYHGYAWRSTVLLFATGVAYGVVYLSSRSLPRIVAAHWLHNLAVMVLYWADR
jgi:membrane protease YdiL (CAAX protease family)